MTNRPTTDSSAVRPRSRHAEAPQQAAMPAEPVIAGEAQRDWILIRVPKASVAKAGAAKAAAPATPAAPAASTAAATTPSRETAKPTPPTPSIAPTAASSHEDKPKKKHFRIDAAHVAVSGPHVAPQSLTERQSKWVAHVGGWKTLTAVGLVVAVLVGAVAARSSKKDIAEESVTTGEKTERQQERERRLARRRAIELRRQGRTDTDSETSADPTEFEPDDRGDISNPTNTATTASWQFEAATNTPASINGRNGRATAVNLNVERSERSAHRGPIGGTGPTLPRTMSGSPDDQSQHSSSNPPDLTSAAPRYRMAANELPTYDNVPTPSPGTVHLRGSIGHAPLHSAP